MTTAAPSAGPPPAGTLPATPGLVMAGAAVLAVGLVLPIVGDWTLAVVAPEWRWVHEPLHAVLEAAGGLIALAVAALLFLRQSARQRRGRDVWIGAALMCLGVLDIAHAAVRPGDLFVALHSAATLLGGLLFAAGWAPIRWAAGAARIHLPVIAAGVSLVIVAVGSAWPEVVPDMVGPDGFTDTARAMNLIGAWCFFAAALRFFLSFRVTRTWDDLLFTIHCALFGAAGALFELSHLWDGSWWWWHALRLLAYAMALTYLLLDYWRIEQHAATLNTALDTANRELEQRVQERTRELEQANEHVHLEMERRQRLEAQRFDARLQHTQKLEGLGILAGGIAHDFNNLLVGVLGNSDLALFRMEAEHPARPLIERVTVAATRASELTSQMLAYSGQGRFVVEEVDLSELTREMTELLEVSAGARAHLKLNLAPALPPVEVDVTQIRQVVMNLITNAADAVADQRGTVRVTTSVVEADADLLAACELEHELPTGPYVSIVVSDDGPGMDPATRARMFDPFFSTKEMGRGLGLAATIGIVRSHGGALRVDSRPGVGTAIQVLLPPAGEPVDAAPGVAPRPTDPQPGSAGRILVVDDDPVVRALASEALAEIGFEVEAVDGGRQCVERYRTSPEAYALVLLDVTMPGMDGRETLAELAAIRPDVRVLLSSGYAEEARDVQRDSAQVRGFLHKPYRVEALREALIVALRPTGS